jgi:diguanylate cyclase (GGDEF)-like protein
LDHRKPQVRAHDWLDKLPIATLALDSAGKVQRVNSALENLVDLSSGELIGHDKVSLPSASHRALLGNEDLICLYGARIPERWLRCVRTTDEQEPPTTYCFYQDVTREVQLEQENAKLSEQVKDLQLIDPLTGLPNRKAISQHLELHVSRSRRYANPLSVIQVSLVNTPDHHSYEPSVLATARYLRDRLRWVDQIARWDDQSFLVVLPETGEAEATEVENNLRAHSNALRLTEAFGAVTVGFRCAAATWQRGDDARSLLRRVEKSLSEVESASSTA